MATVEAVAANDARAAQAPERRQPRSRRVQGFSPKVERAKVLLAPSSISRAHSVLRIRTLLKGRLASKFPYPEIESFKQKRHDKDNAA